MARMPEALAAVVRDRLQLRAALAQAGEVVELRVLDRAVGAALALAGGVDVPDAQAVRAQRRFFRSSSCRAAAAPEGAEDFPELVLRVRIVTLRAQRCDAGEAAEHDQARALVSIGARPCTGARAAAGSGS